MVIKDVDSLPSLPFRNPDHRDGINVVVYRGVEKSLEWYRNRLFKAQHPITDDPGTHYFVGEIVHVKVKRLKDINAEEIFKYHLSEFRSFRDNYDVERYFSRLYGEFFECEELFTYIYFRVVEENEPY